MNERTFSQYKFFISPACAIQFKFFILAMTQSMILSSISDALSKGVIMIIIYKLHHVFSC